MNTVGPLVLGVSTKGRVVEGKLRTLVVSLAEHMDVIGEPL